MNLERARALTLTSQLHARASDRPTSFAIVDGVKRVTFSELDRRTNKLANALHSKGVAKGDRVAGILFDGLPVVETLIACGKLGAIFTPLNWRLAAPEIAHILEQSSPTMLFYSEAFAQLVPGDLTCSVLELPEGARSIDILDTFMALGSDRLPDQEVNGADPLYMLFTSGTTGNPKGCLLSHEGNIVSSLGLAMRVNITPSDNLIIGAPLFHVSGITYLMSALIRGAKIVIAPREADAEQILSLISSEQCTHGGLVRPSILELAPIKSKTSVPFPLKRTIVGSSITPASALHAIQDTLNVEPIGGYGQTEVNGFALMCDPDVMINNPTALGYALPHLEAALLDENGQPDRTLEVGEIGIRSPSVMVGYWNDPAATVAAVAGGWLRTGDLASRDKTGLFHFKGRSKELIKSGGENVYPKEVEDVLLQHAAISDAAIVGVPHGKWGEAVKAYIVLKEGCTLSEDEVVGWCLQHIAGYKRPQYVEFIGEIPRSAMGKVLRKVLQSRSN